MRHGRCFGPRLVRALLQPSIEDILRKNDDPKKGGSLKIFNRIEDQAKVQLKPTSEGMFGIFMDGDLIAEGPSSKELSDWALETGAHSVRFSFDLKLLEKK